MKNEMAPKKKIIKSKAKKVKGKEEEPKETENEAELEDEEESEDEDIVPAGPKAKKSPIDIECVLEPAPIIDEKEDDVPVAGDDDELNTEDLTLDDDDLNPFGDKWEQ